MIILILEYLSHFEIFLASAPMRFMKRLGYRLMSKVFLDKLGRVQA